MKPNEKDYWNRFWEFKNLHKDFDNRIANSLDAEEIEAITFFVSNSGFTEDEVRASLKSYINHQSNFTLKDFFENFDFWLKTSYAQRVLKDRKYHIKQESG